LQWTVARALRWSTPDRIVVVVSAEREAQARRQLAALPPATPGAIDLVAQPSNRGTGPGLMLPLSRIMARDPQARVVVLPSDHYVRDEARFEHTIRTAVNVCDEQVALIGAVPDHAETQYGWIVTGRTLAARRGSVVSRFHEKPPAALAERLLSQGALWNTFIMAGLARHFWALAAAHIAAATARFESYRDAVDSRGEGVALQQCYRCMPVSDFSRDVLQHASDLRAVPLAECGWSDWGTPERVLDSLRHHDDYEVLSRRLAVALLCA
jgi:mannose-1-phosphate guanylyltransferase